MWINDLLDRTLEAIEFSKGRKNALLKKWTFNLNAAGEQEINLAGNFFYIISATDSLANINVQFNSKDSDQDQYNLVQALGITHPFSKLFITWSAQTGKTLTVWIGNLAPDLLSVIDNRSNVASDVLLTQIRDDQRSTTGTLNAEQTVGAVTEVNILIANALRKAFSVQAAVTNTGQLYIIYLTGVTTTKYKVILNAGQYFSDDKYRGAVFAIGSAAGQKCGVQEET